MGSVGGKGFNFRFHRLLIGKKLPVRTNLVLSEQRCLCCDFLQLHQILFQKIMKPCVILLFVLVLRKVAEPVTVMEIQTIKTADLFDFVLPRLQTVLPDMVGFGLERSKSDIVPVL